MPPNNRRAGFMLLEVLAALVVTAALVGAFLPFAGRLASRWWSGEMVVEGADAWMQGIARLSDDLAEAVPFALAEGGGLAFRAGPAGVTFVRPTLGKAAGSPETVTVAVVPAASGRMTLVRRARPFEPAGFASEGGASTTLVEGAFRLRFASVGADGVRHDRWGEAGALPLRLELSVTTPDGKPLFPSAIVLPIPARADPARAARQASAQ